MSIDPDNIKLIIAIATFVASVLTGFTAIIWNVSKLWHLAKENRDTINILKEKTEKDISGLGKKAEELDKRTKDVDRLGEMIHDVDRQAAEMIKHWGEKIEKMTEALIRVTEKLTYLDNDVKEVKSDIKEHMRQSK